MALDSGFSKIDNKFSDLNFSLLNPPLTRHEKLLISFSEANNAGK